MSGGRIAPHRMRSAHVVNRRLKQAFFLRSSLNLTTSVRQNMRELTGSQIRELKARAPESVESLSPKAGARRAASQMLEEIAKTYLKRGGLDLDGVFTPKEGATKADEAQREFQGRVASGLGMVRDADGNVVHLDDKDRPYVLVSGGEIVYVKVYTARIDPKGNRLTAQCTVENPDGLEEVILVEPVPFMRAADDV